MRVECRGDNPAADRLSESRPTSYIQPDCLRRRAVSIEPLRSPPYARDQLGGMTTSRQLLKEESGQYTPKLVAVFYGQLPRCTLAKLRAGNQRLARLPAAVFDPTLGPRVVHQIPEGSVATALSTFPSRTPTPAALDAATPATTTTEAAPTRANPVLFDFSSILDFVIPKPELCGHLITKATRTSKILGFPQRSVVSPTRV